MQAETANLISGVASGVPFLAVPPARPSVSSPVVIAWHMMDPPRTEGAFAAALPLEGLDAWRIYLGLPLSGSRLPAGGYEELMRLGAEDAVLKLQGPVITQSAEEFEGALPELRKRLGLGEGPLGLVGGSVGAAVAQLVLAESRIPVNASVLISPMVNLREAVDAMADQFGFSYPWSDEAVTLARRLDFVSRVPEIAQDFEPAVLIAVGEHDEKHIHDASKRLRDALVNQYTDASRAELVTVPGMAHALADEPGVEPAPQTAHAADVDRHAVRWLRRYLTA